MMSHKILVWLLVLAGILTSAGSAFAQSGGQMCVRAFQDRNGNGIQENGEPFITRGLSATLANADGVIIDSRLMDDSPTAAQGLLCFQRLEPAQYTVRALTADYTPTTQDNYVSGVTAVSQPVIFDFGGEIITATAPQATTEGGDLILSEAEQRRLIQRLVVSGIGSLIVVGFMAAVGAVIYFFIVRQRPTAQPYTNYATGSYAPVTPQEMPPARPPVQGRSLPMIDEPPISDDDTGPNPAVRGSAPSPAPTMPDDDTNPPLYPYLDDDPTPGSADNGDDLSPYQPPRD